MFKTASECAEHLATLKALTADIPEEDIFLYVIPSYTSLLRGKETVAGSKIKIGAQNMGWEERGQFTGEISPLMLQEIGVEMVMVGHSERRHVFLENDEAERKKVACALDHGFTVLLCIGETKEQKDFGISDDIMAIQLKVGLGLVTPEQVDRIMVAYEPVWAIGVNGVPADEHYANDRHAAIKKTLCTIFGEEKGMDIPVLYGGSVNNENAQPLMEQDSIDGLFIGRSAWDAENFNQIIRDTMPIFYNRKKDR